ncbi:GNAT family N-acetyltransferase [Parachitinimonas caeni]|uniref:GNAT family N-acetyltransferase n=1 Tax=Parachitinimonas caeni TaxID=3031301 RepID=A0ABT7E1J1_9NEIS|nr:GNAT family N-acetyltransferase [Parachitinimonas caeni]MDK2126119.1 GNAT family N-acetyltransferase [Parachitinimonas caeni]
MNLPLQIIPLTDRQRQLVAAEWLPRAEAVHRELRPQLPADYTAALAGIVADGGELVIAACEDTVLGIALFHCYRNTCDGVFFYVDDLVTTSAQRSTGVGRALLDWLENEARQRGARSFHLDSGTHRLDAHRFYFRQRLAVTAFHFSKSLDQPS